MPIKYYHLQKHAREEMQGFYLTHIEFIALKT